MPSQPAPMHTPELKPCPFCQSTNLEISMESRGSEHVTCRSCWITGPSRPDERYAAAAWNQRAPSPGEAALLSALQEAENALANSYDVQEYPGDGKTIQDKALASVRAALSAAQANEREGL